LLRALRGSPELRDIPVILLSARAGEEAKVEGLESGADDYLVKPFVLAELIARLRALIRRGATPRPTVLVVGDLIIDPAARTVTRAGADVALTAREFALLHYLAAHAGESLSRDRLLAHVWDDDFDGDPHVVAVYIAYLRAKIDRPFGRRSLETVRGAGYRLCDELAAPAAR
jgi:two-component system, OmpR family, response regulator